jgi:hypothetical protein
MDSISNHAGALRERFAFLCNERSQAEVARRTGASANNVSRYARGTRIPLEFGSSLVESLGVNPAWLLVGEGQPFLGDAPAHGDVTASSLLEMVQAMSAITRLRLGALAGKGHARVLRELNDALVRFESLRAELNRHSRPVLQRMIADYRAQVTRRNLSRAADLERAVEQVSRLCFDDELQLEFETARAELERARHNFERAADIQRAVFLRRLARADDIAPANCLEAQNLAGALWQLGRVHDARGQCIATMALAEHAGDEWPEYAMLQATCAMAEIDLQMLDSALRRLDSALPRMAPSHRRLAGEGFLLRARLLAGTADPRQALLGEHSRGQATALLRHAAWLNDPKFLRQCVRTLIGRGEGQIPGTDPDVRHYIELDAALSRRDRGALARMENFADQLSRDRSLGPRVRFSTFATLAQLARVCGNMRASRRHADEAEAALKAMAPRHTPGIEALAQHRRNQLKLETEPAAREAADWFTQMAGKGFAAFRI